MNCGNIVGTLKIEGRFYVVDERESGQILFPISDASQHFTRIKNEGTVALSTAAGRSRARRTSISTIDERRPRQTMTLTW